MPVDNERRVSLAEIESSTFWDGAELLPSVGGREGRPSQQRGGVVVTVPALHVHEIKIR